MNQYKTLTIGEIGYNIKKSKQNCGGLDFRSAQAEIVLVVEAVSRVTSEIPVFPRMGRMIWPKTSAT